MTKGLSIDILHPIMIEWANEGRKILADNPDIDPIQRKVMLEHIQAAQLIGEEFEKAEARRNVLLTERTPEQVNPEFARLYPDYADRNFSYDAQVTLAIDVPEEARGFNHNYIGTEHILLGLTHADSTAKTVLNKLGVNTDKVRSGVEFIIGRGERAVIGNIGLTPRAKQTLELAEEESTRLQDPQITGEHLLLGIVKGGEGIAAGVLEMLGVSLQSVRDGVSTARAQRTEG